MREIKKKKFVVRKQENLDQKWTLSMRIQMAMNIAQRRTARKPMCFHWRGHHNCTNPTQVPRKKFKHWLSKIIAKKHQEGINAAENIQSAWPWQNAPTPIQGTQLWTNCSSQNNLQCPTSKKMPPLHMERGRNISNIKKGNSRLVGIKDQSVSLTCIICKILKSLVGE